jgi:uncharacterized lipoprotein YddW (UPF0748 family)
MPKTFRIIASILFILTLLPAAAKQPKREFRGMWIATVNNLDWPSRPGLPVEKQQQELLNMLDELQALHFNAVIFQIRPAGDAFYRSKTEPWSHWLTGKQGKAPEGNWDPLAFIITECHKRGMELHAWMNPFRLSQNMVTEFSNGNIAKRHPEWVVTYGNKRYLDPGIPAVRDYLNRVVAEVVRNYDVDAIHFDDYFYPYPVANQPFPDSNSFVRYNAGYPSEKIDAWRRNNVDAIIESLGKTIKAIKPKVKFGISPFGVWQNYDELKVPDGSATRAGSTNYDNLYADVIKWQQKGWIDYLIPQLYWEIGHEKVDYITLANWWSERAYGRHVYIGHALYKVVEAQTPAWKNSEELPEQIRIARRNPRIQGSAYFRMQFLEDNPLDFKNRLEEEFYAEMALLPVMDWIDEQAPLTPHKIKLKKRKGQLLLEARYKKKVPPSADFLGYLLYVSSSKDSVNTASNKHVLKFTPEHASSLTEIIKLPVGTHYLWLTTLDKHHNESLPAGPLKIRIKP